MKKVLLIVIDAFSSHVFEPALGSGQLPHFARLAAAGDLRLDCTSIFPSITPAATSSLITGEYPERHGIMGAYFYDSDAERLNYFGDDLWPIMTRGLGRYFEEFLVELNEDRLQAPTLFELVERAGYEAAGLNYPIYHGIHRHDVHVPLLLRLIPGVPWRATVRGPRHLSLGDFVSTSPAKLAERLEAEGGPLNRFGFQDRYTGRVLLKLARGGAMPALTVAYFPNNDFQSHRVGPANALGVLVALDALLGELFEVFGGAGRMLQELCVIISGDHSQSDIADSKAQATIALQEQLAPFELVEAGTTFSDGDQVMACPNLRAAQFYVPRQGLRHRRTLVERLVGIEPVDQVIWDDTSGSRRVCSVATRDRGTLTFWRGQGGAREAVDDHGTRWSVTGELTAIDATLQEDRIVYDTYPNALERIAGSFAEHITGSVWATARLGAEFALPATKVHVGGGSHGSLHRLDSTSPLLVAGLPETLRVPEAPRTVDLVPLCLSVLGLRWGGGVRS